MFFVFWCCFHEYVFKKIIYEFLLGKNVFKNYFFEHYWNCNIFPTIHVIKNINPHYFLQLLLTYQDYILDFQNLVIYPHKKGFWIFINHQNTPKDQNCGLLVKMNICKFLNIFFLIPHNHIRVQKCFHILSNCIG